MSASEYLVCRESCSGFEINGPFLQFSVAPTCVYCGGPAILASKDDLRAWRIWRTRGGKSDGQRAGKDV